MTRLLAFVACLALPLFLSQGAASANPVAAAYKYTTNVNLYGKPTGMLITGRCNRYASAFQSARKYGAEVLAYLNAASRPDHYVCALDEQFYMGNRGRVPLWPYPSYGQRSIWPNTRMTDLRPGSAWILHVVSYIEGLMREGKVDGVFLDVIGGRPYGGSNWHYWPKAERDKWTDGALDLVKRLDAKRRAIRPGFIIVNNNVWTRPDSTRGLPGELYVNGVTLEHPKVSSTWHINYAKKPFSGRKRRVLIIANSASEALTWSKRTGVTHVSPQCGSCYGTAPKPVVAFKSLN